MKTLDQIIQDFEQEDIEGEGTAFSASGAITSDFDTIYMSRIQTDPAAFSQTEFNGSLYEVEFDDQYKPVQFSTTWLRTHNMTQNMSDPTIKDFLLGLLSSDPRWVFYNYKANIQKLSNNLYTVKIDNKTTPSGAMISRNVEFHINDKDFLEKIRMVQSSTGPYNVSKDIYSQEVKFLYPYSYDQDDDDDQNSTSSSNDDDKDDNDIVNSSIPDLGF